jgi:hypothetical protein
MLANGQQNVNLTQYIAAGVAQQSGVPLSFFLYTLQGIYLH